MAQELKTATWNIGGARLLQAGANPNLISSYTEDGLKAVIDLLGQEQPDVITLQETHESAEFSQPQSIAEALGYDTCVNDSWSESHIERGQKLGQAVISRLPLVGHTSEQFINPLWQVQWENGCVVTSHDKGITTCDLALGDEQIRVQNLHLTPFHLFRRGPLTEAKDILEDVEDKIGDYSGPRIIQGDFNLNSSSLSIYLPNIFARGLREIIQRPATTPKGARLDHVLYSGMKVVNSLVLKQAVLTDHYPVVTTFEIA